MNFKIETLGQAITINEAAVAANSRGSTKPVYGFSLI